MKCPDCGGRLIARKMPDGKVHTWHRDGPCTAGIIPVGTPEYERRMKRWQ